MLNMTRENPHKYNIVDHKEELHRQMILEAEQKRYTLQLKLIALEGKRVLSVQDDLDLKEIVTKIGKADHLINRLKYGEPDPAKSSIELDRITIKDWIARKDERELSKKSESMRTLR